MSLKESQEALDNRPKPKLAIIGTYERDYDRHEVTEWFEDFARKFATYRASLELPVDVWLKKHAKTSDQISKELSKFWCDHFPNNQDQIETMQNKKWVSVPEIQPHLTKLVQERDDNKLLVIQAVTKLRAKEEELEGKILADRKQVSEALKRFEEHAGDYDSETGFFQREDWERLKELLEK